ncbi:MAG: polysaccharide deacetylase family protein [Firmicutes bacterium]|nr:polysaccharide deacetylase family protein [Bacillota bacterium]
MKFILIKKRSIVSALIIAAVLAAAVCGVYFTDAAKVYSSQSPCKMPICSVETANKTVALSFDAAWGDENMDAIINTLHEYDITATFFVTGQWAEKYTDRLKGMADCGCGIEIGTHSNTHPNMTKLSKRQAELELSTSVSVIKSITGGEVTVFRAPYGTYSDAVLAAAEKQGLFSIGYDVDTLDRDGVSAYDITSRVLAQVKNGSIVWMHADGKNTPEALPAIIQGLKNKGYSFTTVGNLIYKDGFAVSETGRQTRR